MGQTLRSFASGQKVFGRYTLARILGRGGMGVVWLARDEQLEVDVALKFLPELLALDPGAIDDMKRETRRSRELSHRNIVKVYHFELENELAAISMEHVDGASLAKLKVDQAAKCFGHTQLGPWLLELADALDYAHSEAKMVHRDLKPANVMLDNRGRTKITDFGIASSIADSVSQLSVGRGSSGTPPYMSPQQAAGRTAQPVDDIYSLGSTIYDLMTGKPPFYSGNIHHQVENIVPPSMTERRTALGNSGEPIPDTWEQTIAACLSKDPAERPKSAAEVVERLELKAPSVLKAVPLSAAATPGKRVAPGLIAGCVVLLVLAGVGYYFASVHRSKRVDTVTAVQPTVSVAPSESPQVAPTVVATPAIVLAPATPEVTASPNVTPTPQPSATPQERKPVAENAALNIPPDIKKLLGTFGIWKLSGFSGSGTLTVSLSQDGKSVSVAGRYALTSPSIVDKGSFHGTVPLAKLIQKKQINVVGRFTQTYPSIRGAAGDSTSSGILSPYSYGGWRVDGVPGFVLFSE